MIEQLSTLQQTAVNSAAEKKAFDILVLDLRNRSDLTDFFIVCSGNSKVHVQSVVDAILDNCYQTHNKPLAIEGYSGGNWVVVDLGDLIVHGIKIGPIQRVFQLKNYQSLIKIHFK